MELSFWKIVEEAGVAMWTMLALSIVAIAVSIERIVTNWRYLDRARALSDTVVRCLGRGALAEARAACERSKSPLADVFLVGFERAGRTSATTLEGAVNRARMRLSPDLNNRLWVLATIGAIAAFIGLGGTVVGIMTAFQQIAKVGGGGVTVVAAGISEALIATAGGIIVAIEGVVLYNYFNQRAARIAAEVKLLIEEFLEALEGIAGTKAETAKAEPAGAEA
jgi:biopolymer transport protein ExbB